MNLRLAFNMTAVAIRNRARDDRIKKLTHEKRLEVILRRYFRRILKEMGTEYIRDGTLKSSLDFADELEFIIGEHYIFIGKRFSTGLLENFDETQELEESINHRYLQSSRQAVHSRVWLMSVTTERELVRTVRKLSLDGGDFKASWRRIQPKLLHLFMVRSKTISVTETQNAAELRKFTEACQIQIFLWVELDSQRVMKFWVTFVDGRERPAHLEADGQIQNVEVEFLVDNQTLAHPGDISHGGSAANVINCVCNAIYALER